MTIRRFSSREARLDRSFLVEQLTGARSYRRIAGYFTSSLFEVAHEALESVGDIKIVCNVDLSPEDLKVAKIREARMLGRWNEKCLEAEALLNRNRYKRLDAFLARRGQVIRVAPDSLCGFVHGKAGVIERADGRKVGFIGSMNETRHGWQQHYEILWEDDSNEGIEWIEAEFEYLWNAARPMPEAVLKEIRRRGKRFEIIVRDLEDDEDIAPSALIESPLYREGMCLQPWQQGFVTECLKHRQDHGVVRLLLADEVGLGKTLSLGTAALTLCLLAEKAGQRRLPVVIFAPATLCEQWQTEMIDKLGIPCARWHSTRKEWLDHEERAISPSGPEHVTRCPLRIGIISTGLMVQPSKEKEILSNLSFDLVILDEAHKARSRQGYGQDAGEPNELLAFMYSLASRSNHVLLGTATPVQTKAEDLWDLVRALHRGQGGFVLGHEHADWHSPGKVLPILNGKEAVNDVEYGWRLLRSPLPTTESTREPAARRLFSAIRRDLGLPSNGHLAGPLSDLPRDLRDDFEDALLGKIDGASFFQRHNPFVRHVVLRKRGTLEEMDLLPRIAVNIHPSEELVKQPHAFTALFQGNALRTEPAFDDAYRTAQAFGRLLSQQGRGSGFMKNLMEQRVCSSVAAGLSTAQALLVKRTVHEETDDEEIDLEIRSESEIDALNDLIASLSRIQEDPKLRAILHFLDQEGWVDLGCIIFSQYYDTARWIADRLAQKYSAETIGLYAGADRSRLYRDGNAVRVERDALKKMVADHRIRIMVATDAACEGLNLQTLGTLINIDLPWNPTRLEQRIGRIKRFGQARTSVDMLNLVHQGTVDEKVYERLSERMRDKYDLFGALPDTIKDEWIDDIESLGEKMDQYIEERRQATGFDLRYNDSIKPGEDAWRDCASVLARRDLESLMRKGWSA